MRYGLGEQREIANLVSIELKNLIHSAFIGDFDFYIYLSNGTVFTNREFYEKGYKLLPYDVYAIKAELNIGENTLTNKLIDYVQFKGEWLATSSTSQSTELGNKVVREMTKIDERINLINSTLKAINTLDMESRHIIICNQIMLVSIREIARKLDKQEDTVRKHLRKALEDIAIKKSIAI